MHLGEFPACVRRANRVQYQQHIIPGEFIWHHRSFKLQPNHRHTLIPVRPVISSILVKPASADCNLHCTYCFYHDRPTDPYGEVRGRHVMDDATLQTLIREGMRLMAPSGHLWLAGRRAHADRH